MRVYDEFLNLSGVFGEKTVKLKGRLVLNIPWWLLVAMRVGCWAVERGVESGPDGIGPAIGVGAGLGMEEGTELG